MFAISKCNFELRPLPSSSLASSVMSASLRSIKWQIFFKLRTQKTHTHIHPRPVPFHSNISLRFVLRIWKFMRINLVCMCSTCSSQIVHTLFRHLIRSLQAIQTKLYTQLYQFAWKYRRTDTRAVQRHCSSHSLRLNQHFQRRQSTTLNNARLSANAYSFHRIAESLMPIKREIQLNVIRVWWRRMAIGKGAQCVYANAARQRRSHFNWNKCQRPIEACSDWFLLRWWRCQWQSSHPAQSFHSHISSFVSAAKRHTIDLQCRCIQTHTRHNFMCQF